MADLTEAQTRFWKAIKVESDFRNDCVNWEIESEDCALAEEGNYEAILKIKRLGDSGIGKLGK
jgi:hypothetical protein